LVDDIHGEGEDEAIGGFLRTGESQTLSKLWHRHGIRVILDNHLEMMHGVFLIRSPF
jgi:hypothetical protein